MYYILSLESPEKCDIYIFFLFNKIEIIHSSVFEEFFRPTNFIYMY